MVSVTLLEKYLLTSQRYLFLEFAGSSCFSASILFILSIKAKAPVPLVYFIGSCLDLICSDINDFKFYESGIQEKFIMWLQLVGRLQLRTGRGSVAVCTDDCLHTRDPL